MCVLLQDKKELILKVYYSELDNIGVKFESFFDLAILSDRLAKALMEKLSIKSDMKTIFESFGDYAMFTFNSMTALEFYETEHDYNGECNCNHCRLVKELENSSTSESVWQLERKQVGETKHDYLLDLVKSDSNQSSDLVTKHCDGWYLLKLGGKPPISDKGTDYSDKKLRGKKRARLTRESVFYSKEFDDMVNLSIALGDNKPISSKLYSCDGVYYLYTKFVLFFNKDNLEDQLALMSEYVTRSNKTDLFLSMNGKLLIPDKAVDKLCTHFK